MIKQIAWNTFRRTGDINTYLELKEVINIEEKINDTEKKVKIYEVGKNQGNSNSRT